MTGESLMIRGPLPETEPATLCPRGALIVDLDQPAFPRRPDHRLGQLSVPQSVQPGRIRLPVMTDRIVEGGDRPHDCIPAGMFGDLLTGLRQHPQFSVAERPRAVDADDTAFGAVDVDVGLE